MPKSAFFKKEELKEVLNIFLEALAKKGFEVPPPGSAARINILEKAADNIEAANDGPVPRAALEDNTMKMKLEMSLKSTLLGADDLSDIFRQDDPSKLNQMNNAISVELKKSKRTAPRPSGPGCQFAVIMDKEGTVLLQETGVDKSASNDMVLMESTGMTDGTREALEEEGFCFLGMTDAQHDRLHKHASGAPELKIGE